MSMKLERLIARPDGSQIKIVTELWLNLFGNDAIHQYVLRRPSKEDPWHCCSSTPALNWRDMSVDEYVRSGRPEMFRYASHGELMLATRDLLAEATRAGVALNL